MVSIASVMMIAWLVVLAVLLYVFRALSRPKVQDEDQTTGTPAGDNSGAASIVVRILLHWRHDP